MRGHIVRVTLAELEQQNGNEVDEAQINVWLDRIYDDMILKEEWEHEYQSAFQDAEQILNNLRPFNSDPQTEEKFEELFDNVDVLPERFEQEYLNCLANDDFIEASRYFVGISSRKYMELKRKDLVRPIKDPKSKSRKWVVRLPYDDQGLSFTGVGGGPDYD